MKRITILTFLFTALIFSANLSAQTELFSEDFDDGIAATRWTISELGASNVYNLAFDYVNETDHGAAPNGGGLCMKVEVNTSTGEESFVGAFPDDLTLSGTYTLTFDAWMNYEIDGDGTTEFLYYGLGHAGTTVYPTDGYDMALTAENGASVDVRLYKNGEEQAEGDNGTSYGSADSRSSQDEPYSSSYEGDVPALQWLKICAIVDESSVTFTVNGVKWASIAEVPTSGNIMIGYMDIWGSLASADSYLLVDNVKVISDATSSIDNYELTNVSVYPNPAREMLNVRVNERAKFELFNTVGQRVMSRMVDNKASISLLDVNAGMYFAKITGDSGRTKTVKVMVK